jgi:hypothetical protein
MKHTLNGIPVDRFLLAAGLFFALVMGLVFHVESGSLLLFGVEIGQSFTLNRMISALLSVTGPFFLLLPFYTVFREEKLFPLIRRIALAPWFLFFPVLLAWMFKTGTWNTVSVLVLLHLTLFLICLSLWVFLLKKLLRTRGGDSFLFLLWALVWIGSDLFTYTHQYLVPYLEGAVFKVLGFFYWFFPPVSSLNDMVSNLLAGNHFSLIDQGWLVLQCIVLFFTIKLNSSLSVHSSADKTIFGTDMTQ